MNTKRCNKVKYTEIEEKVWEAERREDVEVVERGIPLAFDAEGNLPRL